MDSRIVSNQESKQLWMRAFGRGWETIVVFFTLTESLILIDFKCSCWLLNWHELWGNSIYCILQLIQSRPVCFHFIPDIQLPHPGPYTVLNAFKPFINESVELRCDSWFGMTSWMEAHTNVKTTFALQGTQAGGLWQLFEHDLGSHQYRSFTNDKMVITVFNDNGLLRTGSTCFRIAEPDTSIVSPNLATTTNLLKLSHC